MSESKVPPGQDASDPASDDPSAIDDGGVEVPAVDEALSQHVAGNANDVDQLKAELQQAQAQVLRAQADLENYRRRARLDMAEARKYAQLPLLQDLLPALDNFDLAMDALEPNDASNGVLEGVKMVSGQLRSILQQHHCERIDAAGESFDPNIHEAVAQEPSEDMAPGTVIRVVKAGYRLHDRIIRPAQVVVAASASPPHHESD